MRKYNSPYLNYNPCDLICQSHNVKFVKFTYQFQKRARSCGCPVCVGLIRAKVQMEISRGTIIGSHGKRIRINGLKSYKRANPVTLSVRKAIVEACINGMKQMAIAADFDIAPSTVSKIFNKYGGENARRKKAEFAKRVATARAGIRAT